MGGLVGTGDTVAGGTVAGGTVAGGTVAGGTAVDTVALAAAGRTASLRAAEVLGAAGTSGTPLARLGADLAGAGTAQQAPGARQAVTGVLTELGQALQRFGALLDAAAGRYESAEAWAVQSMPSAAGPSAATPRDRGER